LDRRRARISRARRVQSHLATFPNRAHARAGCAARRHRACKIHIVLLFLFIIVNHDLNRIVI
jgi:hypothetical protein